MLFLSCVLLFGVWPKAVIGDVYGTARRCPHLLQTQAMGTSQHLWLLLLLCRDRRSCASGRLGTKLLGEGQVQHRNPRGAVAFNCDT